MPMLHRLKNSVTTTVYQSATQAIKQTHLFSEAKYQILKSGKKKKNAKENKKQTLWCKAIMEYILCARNYTGTLLLIGKEICPRLSCSLRSELDCKTPFTWSEVRPFPTVSPSSQIRFYHVMFMDSEAPHILTQVPHTIKKF